MRQTAGGWLISAFLLLACLPLPLAAQDSQLDRAYDLLFADDLDGARVLARELRDGAVAAEDRVAAEELLAAITYLNAPAAEALGPLRSVDEKMVQLYGWQDPQRLNTLELLADVQLSLGQRQAARQSLVRQAHIAALAGEAEMRIAALIELIPLATDAERALLENELRLAQGQAPYSDPARAALLDDFLQALSEQDLAQAAAIARALIDPALPGDSFAISLCTEMVIALFETDTEAALPWARCIAGFPGAVLAQRDDFSLMFDAMAEALVSRSDPALTLAMRDGALAAAVLLQGEHADWSQTLRLRRAEVHAYLRDFAQAQRDIENALRDTTRTAPETLFDLQALQADILHQQGDLAGAEAAYQRAAEILHKAGLTDSGHWLAMLAAQVDLQATGENFGEAERLARLVLSETRARHGDNAEPVLQARIALGGILALAGKIEEALALLETTRKAIAEHHGGDPFLQAAWQMAHASLQRKAGLAVTTPPEPIPTDDPMEAIFRLRYLMNEAWLQGDLTAADVHATQALSLLHPDDPQRLEFLEVRGRVAIEEGRDKDALALFRIVTNALREPGRGLEAEVRPLHIEAALRMAETSQQDGANGAFLDYLNEALGVMQELDALSAGSAIAQAATRWETKPELAQTLRALQDNQATLATLNAAYGQALARGDDGRDLAKRIVAARDQHAALDAQVARDFPDYARAVNPAPVTLHQIAGWLAPEEALVIFATSDEANSGDYFRSNVLAISQTNVMIGGTLARSELAELATALRCQAALTDPLCGAVRDATRGFLSLDEPEEEAPADGPSFDLALAHRAFETLLGPVAPVISGKTRLILVPDSALVAMPFHTLLARPPDAGTVLETAPWLIRDTALFVVPTIASLDALRSRTPAHRRAGRFLGVGDPLIGTQRNGPLPFACKDAPLLVAQSVIPAEPVMRGGTADPKALAALSALPETRCELRAAAASFGEDSMLLLHGDATETTIKALSASGALADFSTISFATHGLIAGEVGDFDAGIVLTPPAAASPQDDGLLSTGDIAQLTLDADMVLLSACNTAAGDSSSDEGLSGLASAFFYAGARSLLVSHWPVSSDAAVRLNTDMLARRRDDSALGYAEALRRAMLAILDDPASSGRERHPAYWAPFMVVGEGA